ncbi:hypothetical protein C0583_04080, partial [Candidatus Parcubacteria bacterium]
MKKAFPKLLIIAFLTLAFLFFSQFFTSAVDENNASAEKVLPNGYIGGGVAQGWHGDDSSWDYTLPFDFVFYGEAYKDIKIGSNGVICLNGEGCSSWLYTLSNNFTSGPIIAPMWTDLRTDRNSNDIFITENADNVIIRWNAVEYGHTDDMDIELILYDNGSFKFNYGAQATPIVNNLPQVGFSVGDGTNYFESSYHLNTDFDWVDSLVWGFTPIITSTIPSNNGTGANLTQTPSITFDRTIYRATGTISIKQTSDNSLIESFPATSSSITGWGT